MNFFLPLVRMITISFQKMQTLALSAILPMKKQVLILLQREEANIPLLHRDGMHLNNEVDL